MRTRDVIFGALAVAVLLLYLVLGARIAPLLLPGAAATPTPPKPTGAVSAPAVRGTVAFVLRGDVYLLSGGAYVQWTADGRSEQPALSADGRTLYFARVEEIDGLRTVDGQTVPAHLGYSNLVRKTAAGGAEDILVNGLTRAASQFHSVRWNLAPAPSPDGTKLAYIEAAPDGSADLVLYDLATKRAVPLSNGGDWADPAWSPDGKTIVVTSYDAGQPRLLLKPIDGRAATPLKGVPDGEPYRPSYSADGRWIVYTLRHDDGKKNDVHALEIATGRDVTLTSDGQSWNGVLSPDGTQLAYLRAQSFTIDLWVADVGAALTGGGAPKEPVKLTHGEGVDGSDRPAWAR